MRSDVAISVKDLTKTYRIFNHPGDRIKQALSLGQVRFHDEFTALRDLSFEVRKGETIGIVGRNGSGKSTLLQLVCGIIKPSQGTVLINGRVSALLELGAGFNPEFTGRENVYFAGALMSLSKASMDARIEEVMAFADIGEFIDHPVRTYSSGMFVRLAFAVAIHVDPDILVVDEALAVGDVRFQAKCFRRLEALKSRGTTILMVSHALEQITRLCDKVLLLDQGKLIAFGSAGPVVSQFFNVLFTGEAVTNRDDFTPETVPGADFASPDIHDCFHTRPTYNPHEFRWGNRTAVILDYLLRASAMDHATHIASDQENLAVQLKVLFMQDITCPVFGLLVRSREGVTLCGVNSFEQASVAIPRKKGEVVFVEFLLSPHLEPGDYFLSVGIVDNTGEDLTPLDRRYDSIHLKVTGQTRQIGMVNMNPSISILHTAHGALIQGERAL